MLPAKYRLKSREDFNGVFRQGRAVSNDVLLMKYKKLESRELKIGFSAGLKFSKKSSRRNKVKRWMREAVREMINYIRSGWQIIFLINPKFPYEQIDHALIQEKIRDLLGKAKLFRP